MVAQGSRWFVALGLVVTLAGGCGKKEGEGGGGGTEGGGARRASAKVEWLTIAAVLGDSKKPTLLGPFAKGKLGMTKEELAAVSPVFADKGDYLSDKEFGIGFFVYFDGPPSDRSAAGTAKRLASLSLTLADADVAAVAAAWGAPTEVTYRKKPSKAWFDPEAKIRAILAADDDPGKHKLTIGPYLPSQEILGAPGQPLGIEGPRPLLGATPAELKAAYPDNFERDLESLSFMQWPGDEYGAEFKMQLGMKDGKIASLQFWLHHGDSDAVKAQLKAQLEAKYGPAKPVEGDRRGKLQLAEAPKVTMAETIGAYVIEVIP